MRSAQRQSAGRIVEDLPSVRAARAIQARGLSLGVAAAEFGVTRPAVHYQLLRIMRIERRASVTTRIRFAPGPKSGTRLPLVGEPLKLRAPTARDALQELRIATRRPAQAAAAPQTIVAAHGPASARAALAAKYAHDTPCTRDRAAAMFGLELSAVIGAWERLYPEQRRVRVG